MKKDVIYIDIEDDITAIIDKTKSAKASVVALVPPKRSTVLNSAVNMKLLTRASKEAGKKVVLVTNESTLLGLAGGVGLFVTKNLHSKPYVPEAKQPDAGDDGVIDGAELDPDAPIGELAGINEEDLAHAEKTSEKPPKKKSKLKIPSFESFRSRLFLIIGGIILLALIFWWAFFVAPNAQVHIQAQTRAIPVTYEFTADTGRENDDLEKNQLAAERFEIKQTVTESFTPTGKKNIGDKASGPMTIQNCDSSSPISVEEGRIFTSPEGLKFESLDAATVPGGTFSGGGCSSPGEVDVTVRAVAPGADYNLPSGTVYDIDAVGSLVVGEGGQMAGGTDKNVTVVSQGDVNDATAALKSKDRTGVLTELKDQLEDSQIGINESYEVKLGDIKSKPGVGEEASSASVSAEATFSLLAVKRDSLNAAIEKELEGELEGGQSVYDNGLGDARFSKLSGKNKYNLQVNTHVGPTLDTAAMAQEITGKRYGEAVEILKSRPGVIDVQLELSPFWVFSVPGPDKIEFHLEVSGQSG